MKLNLKSIEISNFKGCRSATYNFQNRSNITGKNGIGKTTIATAYYWVLNDSDYELNNNPPVFPLDGRECKPSVTLVVDIDGVEVTIKRVQTRAIKEDKVTGKRSESYSSLYEVNGVEYGLKTYKEKLESYGISVEKLMQFSHPDQFISGIGTKKTREEIRNTLFEMAHSYTDKEIAESMEGIDEVRELLNAYSIKEIDAMQNARKRKIDTEFGKSGEIIDAEIRGKEALKITVDTKALEDEKAEINERVAWIDSELEKSQEGINDLYKKKSEIELDIQETIDNHTREIKAKQFEARDDVENCKARIADKARQIARFESDYEEKTKEINKCQEEIKATREQFESAKAETFDNSKWVFDENSKFCSMCGQRLPEEKIAALIATFDTKKARAIEDFEHDKSEKVAALKRKGNDGIEVSKMLKVEQEEISARIKTLNTELDFERKQCKALEDVYNSIDTNAKVPGIEEKEKALDEIIQKIKAENGKTTGTEDLVVKKRSLIERKEEIIRELGFAQNNEVIERQIVALNEKRLDLEQQKANCEKILYQLKLLERRKNEMLEDSVNQHFKIVKWKLWGLQKNGEIVSDLCIPTVDGKEFGEAMNNGLMTIAKMDIVSGLQGYFKQSLPIFLDNAEHLDSASKKKIEADCQVIYLSVTDGELEVVND